MIGKHDGPIHMEVTSFHPYQFVVCIEGDYDKLAIALPTLYLDIENLLGLVMSLDKIRLGSFTPVVVINMHDEWAMPGETAVEVVARLGEEMEGVWKECAEALDFLERDLNGALMGGLN